MGKYLHIMFKHSNEKFSHTIVSEYIFLKKPLYFRSIKSRFKVRCLARTSKNNEYYLGPLTAEEINVRLAKEAEEIIYSERLRKSGLSIFTLASYLYGFIYWYILPDLIKFLLMRLLIKPLMKPFYYLCKCWVLFQLSFAAILSKDKVTPIVVLRRWHSNNSLWMMRMNKKILAESYF